MSRLNTQINLSEHDDLYQQLVELLEGRSEQEARKVSAKLILLLANHIGDPAVVAEAIAIAAGSEARTVDDGNGPA